MNRTPVCLPGSSDIQVSNSDTLITTGYMSKTVDMMMCRHTSVIAVVFICFLYEAYRAFNVGFLDVLFGIGNLTHIAFWNWNYTVFLGSTIGNTVYIWLVCDLWVLKCLKFMFWDAFWRLPFFVACSGTNQPTPGPASSNSRSPLTYKRGKRPQKSMDCFAYGPVHC